MFSNRSDKNELLDDFSLSNEELRKNLDEMEMLNNWLGSKKLLISALNEIQNKYSDDFKKRKIVIGDLGCGNGDLLRTIDQWAKIKCFNTELIGIDANPSIVKYANERSKLHHIQYIMEDILSTQFSQHQFDVVCLNSICHHFNNKTLIYLLQNLIKQTRLAIIINDLQRHWLSYFSIKLLSKLLNFSYLAKNDAPLSVMRAFHQQELIQLLDSAKIKSYQLNRAWAYRWKLLIWCKDL